MLQIAVNLNGYTKGARNEIFALEPAPVQVGARQGSWVAVGRTAAVVLWLLCKHRMFLAFGKRPVGLTKSRPNPGLCPALPPGLLPGLPRHHGRPLSALAHPGQGGQAGLVYEQQATDLLALLDACPF